jgi:hypothetical protein
MNDWINNTRPDHFRTIWLTKPGQPCPFTLLYLWGGQDQTDLSVYSSVSIMLRGPGQLVSLPCCIYEAGRTRPACLFTLLYLWGWQDQASLSVYPAVPMRLARPGQPVCLPCCIYEAGKTRPACLFTLAKLGFRAGPSLRRRNCFDDSLAGYSAVHAPMHIPLYHIYLSAWLCIYTHGSGFIFSIYRPSNIVRACSICIRISTVLIKICAGGRWTCYIGK